MDTQKDKATPRPWSVEECVLKDGYMKEMVLRHPKGISPKNVEDRLNSHDSLLDVVEALKNCLENKTLTGKAVDYMKNLASKAINQATK